MGWSDVKRMLLPVLFLLLPALVASQSDYQFACVLALFVSVILLWFTEVLPLPVTGLLVPVLIALYGLMPPKSAFSSFGSDILFLFIGCFLLGKAMQKHGWDHRMACWMFTRQFATRSSGSLLVVVSAIAWFLSMWISNTATCVMLTPICLGIIQVLEPYFPSAKEQRSFTIRILLSCAFASTMGGLATPIGTLPNLLAIEFLEKQGLYVNFFEWLKVGLPVSLFMILLLHLLLGRLFPVCELELQGVRAHFRQEWEKRGRIRGEELQVAVVFLLAVLFWTLPGLLDSGLGKEHWLTSFFAPFSLSVVGILAAVILFLLPTPDGGTNLAWSDAQDIDWGTILLFGGGISLGTLLDHSGFALEVGNVVLPVGAGLAFTVCISVFLSILLSEFASNTASASVVYPVILATLMQNEFSGMTTMLILMAASFGASFGFMLPVSTPPNAIVFSTQKIPLREMIRAGIYFDICGALMIVGWILLLL